MNFKKFLILTLITLSLIGCSKSNQVKEKDINSNNNSSIENNKENNTDNQNLKKDNNINYEICNEIVRYQPNDELYYKISDTYNTNANQSVMDFFNSNNSLLKLKDFNSALKLTFDYYEIHSQPLVYNGYFKYDKKFSAFGIINEKIEKQKNNLVLEPVSYSTTENQENDNYYYRTQLKTLIIGKKLYNQLDEYIESGKNFSNEDFIVNSDKQEISVILGNSYKDIYKIGDELNLSLHEKQLKLKVIGFLKKDTKIFSNKIDKNLDETIVIPFYDINYISTDEVDLFYQKLYYSQKNGGLIKLKQSEIDKIIDNVKNIEDIYYDYLKRVEQLAKEFDVLFSIPICPTRIID